MRRLEERGAGLADMLEELESKSGKKRKKKEAKGEKKKPDGSGDLDIDSVWKE